MIYTAGHLNVNHANIRTVAISGNRGKDVGYIGDCYPKLAPKLGFWKIWHDNIGKIDEYENNKYYILEYYNQVLSKLDPLEIYNDLDNSLLLCYEDNMLFCHRHIVAAWLELSLNIYVPEVSIDGYDIVELERPNYIKEILSEIMLPENIKKITLSNL